LSPGLRRTHGHPPRNDRTPLRSRVGKASPSGLDWWTTYWLPTSPARKSAIKGADEVLYRRCPALAVPMPAALRLCGLGVGRRRSAKAAPRRGWKCWISGNGGFPHFQGALLEVISRRAPKNAGSPGRQPCPDVQDYFHGDERTVDNYMWLLGRRAARSMRTRRRLSWSLPLSITVPALSPDRSSCFHD